MLKKINLFIFVFSLFFVTAQNNINIKEKVDYIIHMASLASPKFYESQPVDVMEPNITGTINLLNFSKKHATNSSFAKKAAKIHKHMQTYTHTQLYTDA